MALRKKQQPETPPDTKPFIRVDGEGANVVDPLADPDHIFGLPRPSSVATRVRPDDTPEIVDLRAAVESARVAEAAASAAYEAAWASKNFAGVQRLSGERSQARVDLHAATLALKQAEIDALAAHGEQAETAQRPYAQALSKADDDLRRARADHAELQQIVQSFSDASLRAAMLKADHEIELSALSKLSLDDVINNSPAASAAGDPRTGWVAESAPSARPAPADPPDGGRSAWVAEDV